MYKYRITFERCYTKWEVLEKELPNDDEAKTWKEEIIEKYGYPQITGPVELIKIGEIL